jgi:superfamily I DNA/RNA helicase
MKTLSDEQQAIVDAPLESLVVIACAGSGKTHTAVHRLLEVRRRLGDSRGRVALLSFSNVAVKTFQDSYLPLAQTLPPNSALQRVDIDTLDGFITANLLRPHSARTMGCSRTPFLITGAEPFLKNPDFSFWTESAAGKKFPVPPDEIDNVVANRIGGTIQFSYRCFQTSMAIKGGAAVVARLGAIGAYTHSLGQYWALRTLQHQPCILKALVRRYPHVLVDESQDIGTIHQAILETMAAAGTKITLIGDPAQGIYDFAGANGRFLVEYVAREGVLSYALTRNYRSVPAVVELANALATRTDAADRAAPIEPHGAYFIAYKRPDHEKLLSAFQAAVAAAGLAVERSAVVCRASAATDALTDADGPLGKGLVKVFARAALLRDQRRDFAGAFKAVASAVAGLLHKPGDAWLASVTQAVRHPEMKPVRREIWRFTRDLEHGLPDAKLVADIQWLPLLLVNVRALLDRLHQKFAHQAVDNLNARLTKAQLANAPLRVGEDLATGKHAHLRIQTVHKVKGESLDAVLYLAGKDHAEALLGGVESELGRIGYVAVTRARNLIWLGVPAAAVDTLRPALLARGFKEAGAA